MGKAKKAKPTLLARIERGEQLRKQIVQAHSEHYRRKAIESFSDEHEISKDEAREDLELAVCHFSICRYCTKRVIDKVLDPSMTAKRYLKAAKTFRRFVEALGLFWHPVERDPLLEWDDPSK